MCKGRQHLSNKSDMGNDDDGDDVDDDDDEM